MTTTDMMQDLVDFHIKFGLEYTGKPRWRLEPYMLEDFRATCMREEVNEYMSAKNRASRLDALVDLIYFALGTAYLHGFGPIFYEAWDRVHAANMSKIRSPASVISAQRGNRFDVIKPPNFRPPDLTDLVQR